MSITNFFIDMRQLIVLVILKFQDIFIKLRKRKRQRCRQAGGEYCTTTTPLIKPDKTSVVHRKCSLYGDVRSTASITSIISIFGRRFPTQKSHFSLVPRLFCKMNLKVERHRFQYSQSMCSNTRFSLGPRKSF